MLVWAEPIFLNISTKTEELVSITLPKAKSLSKSLSDSFAFNFQSS